MSKMSSTAKAALRAIEVRERRERGWKWLDELLDWSYEHSDEEARAWWKT